MKAAVLRTTGKLVVEEVPDLHPGPGQVLIKVICCGICGSDLHFFSDQRTPTGIIPGHEWVGTLAELGPGVAGWRLGDRVVMNGYPAGDDGLRPEVQETLLRDPVLALGMYQAVRAGGYGEFLLWGANALSRVPENVSDEEAALTDTLNVGFGAVRASGIRIGDSVAVIGAGPIGLSALLAAKLAGAGMVLVTDLIESKRHVAESLGADQVLDAGQGDVRQEILARTGGGAAIVVDCVGSPSTIQQSVDIVRVGGRVIMVGLTTRTAQIKPLVWFAKGVHFQTALSGSVPLILRLLSEKRVDTRLFVTGKVPLTDIQRTFESLLAPNQQIKILVYP
jgi:(R,R)-butanediol dehydrogenase/meso-butanediol dehydrogenase/diacetyl reductase